ncbi:hypothetical protein LSH36_159g05024 [Paralvinella palmiformis]|uniref:LIM zinc-binding domain-containing protein n=1 Tax=Paralvinella palmiformis TaxID=53620 RepID=A0AAD9N894_9ANNE|nr:hypothetical protein LSH36_159g05024 [Paralvinella palmiformis]
MTMPVIQPEVEPAVCAGCGGRILDRYYLLAVDRPWHVTCLQCAECKLPLDSEATCFAKDENIYCKEDYYRPGWSSLLNQPKPGWSSLLNQPRPGWWSLLNQPRPGWWSLLNQPRPGWWSLLNQLRPRWWSSQPAQTSLAESTQPTQIYVAAVHRVCVVIIPLCVNDIPQLVVVIPFWVTAIPQCLPVLYLSV